MNQLLCTFTNNRQIITTLRTILETYTIIYDKIFIYESYGNNRQFLCTYNVDGYLINENFLPNTISVHRKKDQNVIYTINALNELIREINNGVLDKSFQVNWENYRDYAILITDDELKKIRIKFREVFYTTKKN